MAVVQVAIEDLNDWLGTQLENTIETPYEIEITGLQVPDFQSSSPYENPIKTALTNNSHKYVDLRATNIPNGVEILDSAFVSCQYMVGSPVLPPSTISMVNTYDHCVSLTYPVAIPNGVTNLQGAFFGCQSLTIMCPLPNSVTNLKSAFQGCPSIINPSVIPEGVTDMTDTFRYCTSLAYHPIIPSSVTSSQGCYAGTVDGVPNGGTHAQVEDFVENATDEFEIWEVEGVIPTGRKVYGLYVSTFTTWLGEREENTVDTPYEIKLLNLRPVTYRYFRETMEENQDKYVDLHYTTFLSTQTSLNAYYQGFGNVVYAPDVPSTVTNISDMCNGCYSLKKLPKINSTVITDAVRAFYRCSSITEVDLHFLEEHFSNNALIESIFGETSITQAPIIPQFITNIKLAFEGTPITNVPNVPSSITNLTCAFINCTELESIDRFEVPLSVLKSNTASRCFEGCSSLRQIGFRIDESTDWHVFSLKFFEEDNNDYVSGTIYGVEQGEITTETIAQTKITKTDLQLPILTDELWFPSGATAQEIDSTIRSMLANKYGVYNKEVIPPDGKYMVLWANNKDHFKTNIEMGGSGSGIKVYDTEDDIISDLPNLKPLDIVAYKASKDPKSGVPLGTWASFENDSAPNGEWLQSGTSFDPNTYPALAMMLGGNTVPERFDHNRPSDYEKIVIPSTAETAMTAEYDGEIIYTTNKDVSTVIFINGVQITNPSVRDTYTKTTATFSVKKGDVFYVTVSNGIINTDNEKARWYKHPLFIKATPTSSDSDYEGTLNAIRTYVDNNTQPKSKVWVAVIQDTGATALNLVGIVIPNASKVTSVGFQTIHRDGQSDPMQYVYVDLVNNSSFRLNNGMLSINMIVNGTYDSINDTWTITSRTATSLGFTTMKVNYSEDVTVKNS